MKKVLCFECRNWSTTPEICEHCGNILSRELKKEIQEEEENRHKPPAPPKLPSRISRAMKYLKNSRNPLFNILYYVLMSIWFLYVGIMLVLMYIIFIASS